MPFPLGERPDFDKQHLRRKRTPRTEGLISMGDMRNCQESRVSCGMQRCRPRRRLRR